jgi:hypothetical protein
MDSWSKGCDQKVVSSNPAVYWMDVSDKSSYYIEKENNKDSQMGHTKKVLNNHCVAFHLTFTYF